MHPHDEESVPLASALPVKGRGAQFNPPNRFDRIQVDDDFEQVQGDEEFLEQHIRPRTEYFVDSSRSIISENDSPDVPFRYSINPYRGCSHGCSYCYARPTHEYLGLSAGLDFESKVFVKLEAPALFREHLAKESWRPEPIMLSGVTDCYQPAERYFRLTRQCLEVAWEARQPMWIITKNALVMRDLDLLSAMARHQLVRVAVSVTTLDASLARNMEPRTSTPSARLRAIRALREVGVPTLVMVAPVIPGLNDSEIPSILQAASAHGAMWASYVLLRLPWTVRPVFLDWLGRTYPLKRERVEALIRATRCGKLNETGFGRRMKGSGELAEQIRRTFRVFSKRLGLDGSPPPLDETHFRPPRPQSGQLRLF